MNPSLKIESTLLLVAFFILCSIEHTFANSYTYSLIMPPNSVYTDAMAVNNSDQVVGTYLTGVGGDFGFLDTAGTYTTLIYPGARDTIPLYISNNGTVIGSYYKGNTEGAFEYEGGQFSKIINQNLISKINSGVFANFAYALCQNGYQSCTHLVGQNLLDFAEGPSFLNYYFDPVPVDLNIPNSLIFPICPSCITAYPNGFGINSFGQISGYFEVLTSPTRGYEAGFLATPVVSLPVREPSSWSLLAVALLGSVFVRYGGAAISIRYRAVMRSHSMPLWTMTMNNSVDHRRSFRKLNKQVNLSI